MKIRKTLLSSTYEPSICSCRPANLPRTPHPEIRVSTIARRWVAVAVAIVGFAIPVLVAASRVYRGMHYLTDVVAGAIAGGIWLTTVLVVLLRTPPPAGRNRSIGLEGRA